MKAGAAAPLLGILTLWTPAHAQPRLSYAGAVLAVERDAHPRLSYIDSVFAGDTVYLAGGASNGRVPAPVAAAPDSEGGFSISGSVGGVSDYRFRGVSLSNGRVVPQAGVTASYGSFSGGIWTSRIAETAGGSRQEVDLSLAATTSQAGFDLTGTMLLYVYPGDRDAMYGEAAINAARSYGPVDMSIGLFWAPSQSALGGEDNLYVNLGTSWESPFANLSMTVGREWGAFAPDGKWDWSLTAAREIGPLNVSISYVDSDARVLSSSNKNLAGSTAVLGVSLNY